MKKSVLFAACAALALVLPGIACADGSTPWGGPYAQAGVGYSSSDYQQAKASGAFEQLRLGYDYLLTPDFMSGHSLVAGAYLGGNLSQVDSSVVIPCGGGGCQIHNDTREQSSGFIGARLGYLANEHVLVYGTVSDSVGGDFSNTTVATYNNGPSVSGRPMHFAGDHFATGGGVEIGENHWAISFEGTVSSNVWKGLVSVGYHL